MRIKNLIVLPLIFTVGLLFGHLMLVLATVTVPNPGHSASQIGAGEFADDDIYRFKPGASVGIGQEPGNYKLNVVGNIWANGIDVVGNALVTGQTRIQGWTFFKEGDIVIQSRDNAVNREAQIFNLAGGALYIRSDLNADNDKLGSISLQAATTSVSGNLNVGGSIIGIKVAHKHDSKDYYKIGMAAGNENTLVSITPSQGYTSLIPIYNEFDIRNEGGGTGIWLRVWYSDGTYKDLAKSSVGAYGARYVWTDHDITRNSGWDIYNYYESWSQVDNDKSITKIDIVSQYNSANAELSYNYVVLEV